MKRRPQRGFLAHAVFLFRGNVWTRIHSPLCPPLPSEPQWFEKCGPVDEISKTGGEPEDFDGLGVRVLNPFLKG